MSSYLLLDLNVEDQVFVTVGQPAFVLTAGGGGGHNTLHRRHTRLPNCYDFFKCLCTLYRNLSCYLLLMNGIFNAYNNNFCLFNKCIDPEHILFIKVVMEKKL